MNSSPYMKPWMSIFCFINSLIWFKIHSMTIISKNELITNSIINVSFIGESPDNCTSSFVIEDRMDKYILDGITFGLFCISKLALKSFKSSPSKILYMRFRRTNNNNFLPSFLTNISTNHSIGFSKNPQTTTPWIS